MKLLTLDDYQKAGEHFWDKFYYVMKELGENASVEDTLRVMESLGGVAMKLKSEEEDEKAGPFGFNKKTEEKEDGSGEV